MTTATIRLTNSILGWMLVPSYRHPSPENGVESVLSLLYGEDWLNMKSSDRAFMKGEPVEKVIAHIKEVCKSLNVGVSFCGNRKLPTIRLWLPKPQEIVTPTKVSVDLKWSCWTTDESVWEEYAPGVWEQMRKAWAGETGPVEVATGPRKEIRYGLVTIYKGEAHGYFYSNWDECYELAQTLGTECNDAFCEMIPHSIHAFEPGVDWDFSVKARSFNKLIERIDNEENNLLEADKREWESIEACFKEKV